MPKKMKMLSLFKTQDLKQPWQWPSCNPKTLSFRATNDKVFKTINSVFLDTSDGPATPDSWFTNSSSECASTAFSTDEHSEENNNNNNNNNNNDNDSKVLEMIIRDGRSSDRLFFEPGNTSSRILDKEPIEEGKNLSGPFEESMALAVESDDPYMDFKESMQEMVESHGMEEWDSLEELLGWYLRMNAKHNHGFIVGAFVDLLVGMAMDSSTTTTTTAVGRSDSTSYSSADSSFS